MGTISAAARSLWAKKERNGGMRWLPLPVHMADSAALAGRLWNRWLSPGVQRSITEDIDGADPRKFFRFLAAAHDLGKATPVFQAKTGFPESDLDRAIADLLQQAGLPMRPAGDFTTSEKTPHALATQVLLENAGIDRSIAVILGSHHGRPPDLAQLEAGGVETRRRNYHLEGEGKKPGAPCSGS